MKTIDIFISSVMNDLRDERDIVAEAIKTRNGLSPVFAEDWPANDEPPIHICKEKVQACNIYIGIFDKKWGYIPKKDNPKNLSITAMEYSWAKEKELSKFIFVSAIDDDVRESLLKNFLKDIKDFYKGHWCKKYDSKLQLRNLVLAAIDNILVEKFHAKDHLIKKTVTLENLKLIDLEKRKRDKIARDLLAEVQENKSKIQSIATNNLHEFDTTAWNRYRGDLDFFGSGLSTSLRSACIQMKEQNNYLEAIKSARDTSTERRRVEQYSNKEKLETLHTELISAETIFTEYLEASGDYPQI